MANNDEIWLVDMARSTAKPAMSVDSADNPTKSVLLPGSLLDVFRAVTIDGFITTKITDKSRMNISNDILSL